MGVSLLQLSLAATANTPKSNAATPASPTNFFLRSLQYTLCFTRCFRLHSGTDLHVLPTHCLIQCRLASTLAASSNVCRAPVIDLKMEHATCLKRPLSVLVCVTATPQNLQEFHGRRLDKHQVASITCSKEHATSLAHCDRRHFHPPNLTQRLSTGVTASGSAGFAWA